MKKSKNFRRLSYRGFYLSRTLNFDSKKSVLIREIRGFKEGEFSGSNYKDLINKAKKFIDNWHNSFITPELLPTKGYCKNCEKTTKLIVSDDSFNKKINLYCEDCFKKWLRDHNISDLSIVHRFNSPKSAENPILVISKEKWAGSNCLTLGYWVKMDNGTKIFVSLQDIAIFKTYPCMVRQMISFAGGGDFQGMPFESVDTKMIDPEYYNNHYDMIQYIPHPSFVSSSIGLTYRLESEIISLNEKATEEFKKLLVKLNCRIK